MFVARHGRYAAALADGRLMLDDAVTRDVPQWKADSRMSRITIRRLGSDTSGMEDAEADDGVPCLCARARMRERGAHEFLERVGQAGQPAWTRHIEERGAVFENPDRCYRSGISYSAGLERYIWSQTPPGGDARFEGGFGVYDAPAAWGPGTTVVFAERWDVGPGESSSCPPKWMSPGGRVLHLVFSRDDAFSVPRAGVKLADGHADRGGRHP